MGTGLVDLLARAATAGTNRLDSVPSCRWKCWAPKALKFKPTTNRSPGVVLHDGVCLAELLLRMTQSLQGLKAWTEGSSRPSSTGQQWSRVAMPGL